MTTLNWKEVGERIKILESQFETVIPLNQCYVVRLDGCAFSTFT